MPQLKFTRKLGTTWVFPLTWIDREGNRQTITGSTSRTAYWRTTASDTVLVTDTGGITIDETADPETFGDFTYRRTDLTLFEVGRYRLDFEATMNAEIVPTPENGYITVEVIA